MFKKDQIVKRTGQELYIRVTEDSNSYGFEGVVVKSENDSYPIGYKSGNWFSDVFEVGSNLTPTLKRI